MTIILISVKAEKKTQNEQKERDDSLETHDAEMLQVCNHLLIFLDPVKQ